MLAPKPWGARSADLLVPADQAHPNVIPWRHSTGNTSQIEGQAARVEYAISRRTKAATTRCRVFSVPSARRMAFEQNRIGTSAASLNGGGGSGWRVSPCTHSQCPNLRSRSKRPEKGKAVAPRHENVSVRPISVLEAPRSSRYIKRKLSMTPTALPITSTFQASVRIRDG